MQHKFLSITGLWLLILVLACVIGFQNFPKLLAQGEDSKTFEMLFLELVERTEQETGFIFTIVLANPANDVNVDLAVGSVEDGFTVSEIGKDYICLNRTAGAALTKSCIPFSNIGSIALLDN